MKLIQTFNEKEKEIHRIACDQKVDYKKIDWLLKNGASANAIEISQYENEELDCELLLVQCWLDGGLKFNENGNSILSDKNFNFKLLKIFIDNGLDVDKYINNILGNIQFAYDRENFIPMVQLLLENLKSKKSINLEKALNGIGTEESYHNCCTADHEYANILSTMYEMIEKYVERNDNPKKYAIFNEIFEQEIISINLYYDDLKIDNSNKFIADNVDIFIKCEKDKLDILNKYIFINNNKEVSNYEKLDKNSYFEKKLKEKLIGQKIIDIKLKNKIKDLAPKAHANITVIEITLSNQCKLIIDMDESVSFMRLRIVE